jgi:hypothetical protein
MDYPGPMVRFGGRLGFQLSSDSSEIRGRDLCTHPPSGRHSRNARSTTTRSQLCLGLWPFRFPLSASSSLRALLRAASSHLLGWRGYVVGQHPILPNIVAVRSAAGIFSLACSRQFPIIFTGVFEIFNLRIAWRLASESVASNVKHM